MHQDVSQKRDDTVAIVFHWMVALIAARLAPDARAASALMASWLPRFS
jgi:hypothetical protein